MTLDEFLSWEDGTDTRYELIRGVPVARETAWPAHGMLHARAAATLHSGLDVARTHIVLPSFAVASRTLPDTCYLADLVVQPRPIRRNNQLAIRPVLSAEITSEATAARDCEKALDYRDIPSIHEVLLIDSWRVPVEVHERRGFDWHVRIIDDLQGTATLASVGIEFSISDLYEGLMFDEDDIL